MSVQAISWVLENSESRLGARLVLISIANHASHDGDSAWPSIATIAAETGLSERQVQYAIPELEALGELRVERGGGRGNTHKFFLTKCQEWVQSLHRLRRERVQSTTVKGEQTAPEPSLTVPKQNRSGLSDKKNPIQNGDATFKTFAIVCTRLVGRHPTRQKGVREAYFKLVTEWGEDKVLEAFEKVWVGSRGGKERLRENPWAVMDFLRTEGPEILEAMEQGSEKAEIGAGIPELNPDEEY